MSYRHRLLGYNRHPIHNHAEWGLWTGGQRFRQDPTRTIEHTRELFRNLDTNLTFVGNALDIVSDRRASFFRTVMSSDELRDRMTESIEDAFGEIVRIRENVNQMLTGIDNNHPHTTGPEGVFEFLTREVSHRYDFVAPQGLPHIIANFVDVTHEMEQYRNKERRRASGEFKERAKQHIGSILGNDTTEQMVRLQHFAARLSPNEFTDFLIEYNKQAIVVNLLLELRNTGDMGIIRDRLTNLTNQDLYNYSPYHTYGGGRQNSNNGQQTQGPGNAPASPSATIPPAMPPSGALASKKTKINGEMINYFTTLKKELLRDLEMIDSSAQTQNIAQINHDSIELVKSINTMSSLASDDEKKIFAEMAREIERAFEGRASKISMQVRYVTDTGSYNLNAQDAYEAFEEWKQSVQGWHRTGVVVFAHSGGGLYTENEVYKLLDEKRKQFFNQYNKKLELHKELRDRAEGDGKPDKGTAPTIG